VGTILRNVLNDVLNKGRVIQHVMDNYSDSFAHMDSWDG